MLPHYERIEKALDGFKKALESSQRALRSSQHAILVIHVQALVQGTLVRDVLNSRLIMREASALIELIPVHKHRWLCFSLRAVGTKPFPARNLAIC